MTQPTEQQARAALDNYLSQYRQAKRDELLDAYRAAVLREAAGALDADMEQFFTEWPDEPRNSSYANARKDAVALLRRMAEEART